MIDFLFTYGQKLLFKYSFYIFKLLLVSILFLIRYSDLVPTGGSSPSTLPLPLAAFVSLTITYKIDGALKRLLNLAGPVPWSRLSMALLANRGFSVDLKVKALD